MSESNVPEQDGYPKSSPWSWVPSLYFTQGLPYALVNTVSTIMYTRMGASLKDIGLYTSLLGMAWVVKPLWGPLVDLYFTKRKWTVLMQIIMGIFLIGVGACISGPGQMWWWGTLSAFSLVALFSATHDIAADGYYMVALSERKQSLFVGIRSTFYRLSLIFGTGILFILIGKIEEKTSPEPSFVRVVAKSLDGEIQKGYEKPLHAEQSFLYSDPASIEITPGTTASLTLKLKEAPKEDEFVVTLAPEIKGTLNNVFKFGPEKQVSIDQDRLVFTKENWDKGLPVVFKVDQNLKKGLPVDFKATAGNQKLTWSIVYMGLGVFIVLLGFYHVFALKNSSYDGPTEKAKTPFPKALLSMILVVGIPIALYWGTYESLYHLIKNSPLNDKLVLKLKDPDSIYKFGINIFLLIVVWSTLKLTPVGVFVKDLFVSGARGSGVPYDRVFSTFFKKSNIGVMLLFLLFYRFGEAFLVKMSGPFLTLPRSKGGIGLDTASYGLAYGTIGVLTMTIGGILGGMVISKYGLKKWLLPMCLILNIPHLAYVYLAYEQPTNLIIVMTCVAVETFGYGFGFTAYMMYMLYIAEQSEHKTSHYALCTGFMALGMMVPGMISGDLAETLGWKHFYIFVCLAGLPGLLLLKFVPLDPEFGCRKEK